MAKTPGKDNESTQPVKSKGPRITKGEVGEGVSKGDESS
jgi:hypothetical protein